jgi:hypothetical protein
MVQKSVAVMKHVRHLFSSEMQNRSAGAHASGAKSKEHRLIVQVNSNDPAAMIWP